MQKQVLLNPYKIRSHQQMKPRLKKKLMLRAFYRNWFRRECKIIGKGHNWEKCCMGTV